MDSGRPRRSTGRRGLHPFRGVLRHLHDGHNTERAFLGLFQGEEWLAIGAALLLLAFVAGVVIASLCRRHLWVNHPHGATVLTTLALVVSTVVDLIERGWTARDVPYIPILFVAFGIGALNTSFVKDGEVSIPLSYVTGTLVKLGQGIERHISGGDVTDWLGYFLLWAGFAGGPSSVASSASW